MKLKRMGTGMVLILTLSLVTAACGSPEARKEKYLSQAKTFITEKNWSKARVALRNVLKIDPKDADAYFLFARVEEKEKNWRNAFGNYIKVVELKPEHREAWIKVGRFYLAGGNLDKVTEAADRVLKRYPGDPSAETLKAAVWVKKGRTGEALMLMEKVAAHDSSEPDAVTLLASLYGDRNRWADAEGVLYRAVQIHPDNVVLLDNLAQVHIRQNEFDEAERSYRRIVSVEPEEFGHWVRLAAYYDLRRDTEKAEAALREAVRLNPGDEQRWLTLAQYLATHKDIREGEAVLLSAGKSLADSMKIRFTLGKFYEATRQPVKARKIYEEIVDDDGTSPSGLEARVNLAALDLADGKQEAAEEEIRSVLDKNPRSAAALFLWGRIALVRGDGKEAVQSFRSLLKDQPERADVHVLLGQSYLALGEKDLARESLMKGLAIDPRQIDGLRTSALLEAEEGRRVDARSHLKALLKEFPGDLETYKQLLKLQMADRDWKEAEETLSGMKEMSRRSGMISFEVDMATGLLSEGRRQWARAESAYQHAWNVRPDTPGPVFALVRVQLSQKKAGEAESFLRQLLAKKSDHPYAHGLLGEILLLRGDPAGAMREMREAARLKPDWTAPWLDMADLERSRKQWEESIEILEKGVKANPKSEDLRILLAMTLGEAGRTDQAIKTYDAVLQENPRAVLAANNLAVLLMEKKSDAASLHRALELTRDFDTQVSNPLLLDTRGWVYVKVGRYAEALKILRMAVGKDPAHPELNYHLGMAFYKAGKVAEARNYLTRALHSDRPFNSREEARTLLKQIG